MQLRNVEIIAFKKLASSLIVTFDSFASCTAKYSKAVIYMDIQFHDISNRNP